MAVATVDLEVVPMEAVAMEARGTLGRATATPTQSLSLPRSVTRSLRSPATITYTGEQQRDDASIRDDLGALEQVTVPWGT